MLFNLALPQIVPLMEFATVDAVHARFGGRLALGAKLVDLTVDLSAAVAHDCPPLSHYRIALRDPVWLRRLDVRPGQSVSVGAPLALFSSEPDEPLEGPPARSVRVSVIGIIGASGFAGEHA